MRIIHLLALLSLSASAQISVPFSFQPRATMLNGNDDVLVNVTNLGTGTFTVKRASVSTIGIGVNSNSLGVITPETFVSTINNSDSKTIQAAVDAATVATMSGMPLNVSLTRPVPYTVTNPIYLYGTVHINGNAQGWDGDTNNPGAGFGAAVINFTGTNGFVQTNFMSGTIIEGLSIIGPGASNFGTYGIRIGGKSNALYTGQNNIIRNCTIRSCEKAIVMNGSDNFLVDNVAYTQVTNAYQQLSGGTIQAGLLHRFSGFRLGTGYIFDGGVTKMDGCDTFSANSGTVGIDVRNGAFITMDNMNVESAQPGVLMSNLAIVHIGSGLFNNGGAIGPSIIIKTAGSDSVLSIGDSTIVLNGDANGVDVLSGNGFTDDIRSVKGSVLVSNFNYGLMYYASPYPVSLGFAPSSIIPAYTGGFYAFDRIGGLPYDGWIGHSIIANGKTNWANFDAYSVDWSFYQNVNYPNTALNIGPITTGNATVITNGLPQIWGADVNANTITRNVAKDFRIQTDNYSKSNKVGWIEFNAFDVGQSYVEIGREEHGAFATTGGFLSAGTNDNLDPGVRLIQWDWTNGLYSVGTGYQGLGKASKSWSATYTTNLTFPSGATITNNGMATFTGSKIVGTNGGVAVTLLITNGLIMNVTP